VFRWLRKQPGCRREPGCTLDTAEKPFRSAFPHRPAHQRGRISEKVSARQKDVTHTERERKRRVVQRSGPSARLQLFYKGCRALLRSRREGSTVKSKQSRLVCFFPLPPCGGELGWCGTRAPQPLRTTKVNTFGNQNHPPASSLDASVLRATFSLACAALRAAGRRPLASSPPGGTKLSVTLTSPAFSFAVCFAC